MTADFTVNTDFAQVEADEQQVNLTRFSLFFPEKREFFLEGSGHLRLRRASPGRGSSGARGATRPSCSSAAASGSPVASLDAHPRGRPAHGTGGQVHRSASLNLQTGESVRGVAPATNFSVARGFRRDRLRSAATSGRIFTNRSVSLAGPGLEPGAWGPTRTSRSSTTCSSMPTTPRRRTPTTLSGNNRSYLAKVENNGDRYGFGGSSTFVVGGDFNPEVGFVRRSDFSRNFARAYFSPRPASIGSAVRKIRLRSLRRLLPRPRPSGFSRRRELTRRGSRFELENGDDDGVHRGTSRAEETLDLPLRDRRRRRHPDRHLPISTAIEASYELGTQRRGSWARLSVETGGFFGGTRTEAGYWGRDRAHPAALGRAVDLTQLGRPAAGQASRPSSCGRA